MNWLFVFLPITVALEHFAPDQSTWIFASAALAIMPIAGWMGRATEQLAERTGEAIGGLLIATFGNAAELIICLAAVRAGLYDVVKASLVGSIVGNILLVMGLAMLIGGLGKGEQHYNAIAARSQATMLALAVVALILPAAFRLAMGEQHTPELASISLWISVVLIAVYAANMTFTLLAQPKAVADEASSIKTAHPSKLWSIHRAVLTLCGTTIGIAWMSEILVKAIEPASERLGINDMFVGVFVVAVLGNAAEYATAVVAASKDRMELAISIAIGSSVQVALFVAPVLVLLSYVFGPTPMDLAFSGGLVLSITLAVWITGQLAGDGRSNWLRGVQLLAVYLILAIVFFFAPGVAS
ncbi:calcium/proton exchanger [Aeoliella sp. SH292]|uniref:calcium/proton exchanger n=1 Tax=Aeoliella sp. SH292 TaxID=3454464 RepID=UPI003F9D1209